MIKSELITALFKNQTHLNIHDVELVVKCLIESMTNELASGGRVEVRGFGSFSLRYRSPRIGRNPRTGESVALQQKHSIHFKPGLELRSRVCESANQYRIVE